MKSGHPATSDWIFFYPLLSTPNEKYFSKMKYNSFFREILFSIREIFFDIFPLFLQKPHFLLVFSFGTGIANI